jgi:hydroxypyruvate reductase 2
MRMITTATTKPAVLQIGAVVPMLREALERKYDFYALDEQLDEKAFLAKKGPSIRGVVACTDPDCDSYVDKELVSKLPNLEIVSSFQDTDVKKIVDVHLCKKLGVQVTDTRDAVANYCAATALRLLMAVSCEVVDAGQYVRASRWPTEGDYPIPFRLCNKHIGIIGLGKIGAAIARRMEGFGCTVGYWSKSAKPQCPNYIYYANVVDLAKHSDILIAACTLTEDTKNIINREVLDALGPLGFVVNVSQGLVIDEAELVSALKEGRIAGAGLDVFENEPHIPDELMNLDTCVLQPHAGSSTMETYQAMANMVAANLEAHFAGKPLLTPVC